MVYYEPMRVQCTKNRIVINYIDEFILYIDTRHYADI